ncbi:MAG: phage major capsid protein [Treponema sp.]|nr:phage major capsid protein [Treponema sp.]
MNEKLLEVNIELRKLSEKIKDGSVKAEDAQKELDTLKTQKREIEQKIAQANIPTEERTTSLADIKKAMIEKRAITLNGTGAINQVKELQKELSRKKEILNLVRYFYGPNAATNIPILSPGLATPATAAEGATGINADTQAALGNKSLTPHAFVSILPVSAETLSLGSINFEAELPAIFADAFADGFAKQVIEGDGTGLNFNGLFTGLVNNVECSTVGSPKIADLVSLALTMKDYTDDAVIVMHPTVYSAIQADATVGVAQLYKEELIRSKTIEGVKVILTGYAPSETATGSTVAVAGRMSDYGLGLASEITIEPIKKVGDTNTYFQAIVFANGHKIIGKNFYGLKTK